MKIWVIGRGYPIPENKMLGSFELEQAKLLARNGHDVCYIALMLQFLSHNYSRGYRHFEEDDINIFTYSHVYFPTRLGIYLERYEDKCWQMLFDEAEAAGGLPDIIHIHYPTMLSSINVIEKYRKKGVKIFVTEHWTKVQSQKIRGHDFTRLKYYTSHANCFITVGQNLQDSIKQMTDVAVPMEVVPNMFSPVFQPAPKKDTEKFTFVMSGRMVPHKRFDVVVQAFMQTFEGQNQFHLKLIGDGSEKKKLMQLSKNSPQIEFTGSVNGNVVANEVAQSDVLICVSSLETFAVPVIEAWACGIPVITLDSIPASRYCDESNGIVLREDSLPQLGEVMKKIYVKYDQYQKDKIAEFARSNFGDKEIIRILENIYMVY